MSHADFDQPRILKWVYGGVAILAVAVLLVAMAWIWIAIRDAVRENPNAGRSSDTALRLGLATPRPAPRPAPRPPRSTLSPPAGEPQVPEPDPAALTAAQKKIHEAHPELRQLLEPDSAEAKPEVLEQRLALADKLFRQACVTKDAPAMRFALLDFARDLAARGGSYDAANWAIDALDRWYDLQTVPRAVSALEAAAKIAKTTEQWQRLARSALALAETLAEDPTAPDPAKPQATPKASVLAIAMTAAEKTQNERLIRYLQKDRQDRSRFYAAVQRLLVQPRDPEAHEAVGRWLCFHNGRWLNGTIPLFQSADATLKELGRKEMMATDQTASTATDVLALADALCDYAQQQADPEKSNILIRARHWYQQAKQKTAKEPGTKTSGSAPAATTADVNGRIDERLKELAAVAPAPEFPLDLVGWSWESPKIGQWFGPRRGNAIQFALAQGCDDAAVQAIAAGLRWLAAHQHPDGHWSFDKYHTLSPHCYCRDDELERKVEGNDTAATSLAVLSILGAGHSHLIDTRYRKPVFSGLLYLLGRQKDEGGFGGGPIGDALATLAICDAYGVTADQKLGAAAQRAVHFLTSGGSVSGKSSASVSATDHDLLVTVWELLALRWAEFAGLQVDAKALEQRQKELDACGMEDQTRYAAKPGGSLSVPGTAAALLCRQYLGWQPQKPQLVQGSAFLEGQLASSLHTDGGEQATPMGTRFDATELMFNMGGKNWQDWHPRMRNFLCQLQKRDGHRQGSWDPAKTDPDATGGRVYATSLALLTLEVYFRHPSLSETVRQ